MASPIRNPRSAIRNQPWLTVAAFLIAGLGGLRAETTVSVPLAPGAEASIKAAIPSDEPPRFGFAPVKVTIENTAAQERTWQFQFGIGTRGTMPGIATSTRAITIPAGQLRDVWVYVPVAEAGELGTPPTLTPTGITAGTTPVTTNTSGTGRVTISSVGGFTKVTREIRSGSRVVATEITEINEATGELSRSHSNVSGSSTSTSRNRPPRATDVTYTIDPATGTVSTHYSPNRSGPPKVTITRAARPASAATPPSTVTGVTPGTTVPVVTIAKTPIGTRVTRVRTSGTGVSNTEEVEIDAQTGVMTTIRTSSGGARMPPTRSAPADPGTIRTYTIDPVTGRIAQATASGRAGDPPRIIIETRPLGGAAAGGGTPPTRRNPAALAVTLSVTVSGPGAPAGVTVNFPVQVGDANMRPVAASPAIERVLEQALKAEGISIPNLEAVVPEQLPADWRAWSSFAVVMLTTDEYAGLDLARRSALRAWVGLGGKLYLFPSDTRERKVEKCGAGEIITLAGPLGEAPRAADLHALGWSLNPGVGYPERSALGPLPGSPLQEATARVNPGTLWVGIFMVAFALVVGPVNLFVFAPPARRHRLFYTTPLISVAAVAVLAGAIVVQDGVGGVGWRRALVVLIPGENQAAIFQEQGSRTGFLARSRFELPDDVQLAMLPVPGTWDPRTEMSFSISRTAGQAEGSWFRSRNVQGHLLQRAVPTRGRVQQAGTTPDGTPIVVSSLSVPLRDFWFTDATRSTWRARELVPGQRVTLERATAEATPDALGGTRRLTEVFAAAGPQEPGHWWAKMPEHDLAPIRTLESLDWARNDVFVTGQLEPEQKVEAFP